MAVSLFVERPEIAVASLRMLGVRLPPRAQARPHANDLTDLVPAELRADNVVQVVDPEDRRGRTTMIIVEIQHGADRNKRFSWPLYVASLRHRHRCPVILLVVATTRRAARWCARPFELTHGVPFAPCVLGPDQIPVVTDPAEALGAPDLSLLSWLAHRDDPEGPAVARAYVKAAAALDDPSLRNYALVVLRALPSAVRATLEKTMSEQLDALMLRVTRPYVGKYVREAKKKAIEKGKAEGLAKGKAEGLAKGKAEGLAKGKAEALLLVLQSRGFAISRRTRERVARCHRADELDRWLVRAATARRLGDVFAAR